MPDFGWPESRPAILFPGSTREDEKLPKKL